MYKRSIFIFRQDLRIQDNTGLREAMKNSFEVFPIFIHDTRAIADFGESDPRFGLIREALEAIDTELQKSGGRLSVYRGDPSLVIAELCEKYGIDAIFCNRSYSPRGRERDDNISLYAMSRNIGYHSFQDFLIAEGDEIEQRKVFTPFSMLWKKFVIAHPERLDIHPFDVGYRGWFVGDDHQEIRNIISIPHHKYWTLALGQARMERDFSEYESLRNTPSIDGSTRLSPYIRFGIFSIREVYQKCMYNHTLLSEIIWREFWYHIAYYFPFTYDLEFQERRRSIEWKTDTKSYEYEKFEKGETGYPLVDAAIQQLRETNWMHNRLRMVVASFLTKNLGYDWRIGEKFFQKYLIDYDEAVNIGNWQWSASVGADPKPVRIFNPLLQSEKFDSEAKFIKKYIPELTDVNTKTIHTLDLSGIYIRPIVDQKESARDARIRYSPGTQII